MACLSCPSSLHSVSPADLRIKFKKRPYKLDLIEISPIHRLTLLDWTAQLSASNDKLIRKLNRRMAPISNLYRILGFFLVFEGLIVLAAAHIASSNINMCGNSGILSALSFIAAVATVCASIQELREFASADKSYFQERDLCSALSASIQRLKEQGPDFDVIEGQPMVIGNQSQGFRPGVGGFCEKWVWSYAGAVFTMVVLFSGATLGAINVILCHHQ